MHRKTIDETPPSLVPAIAKALAGDQGPTPEQLAAELDARLRAKREAHDEAYERAQATIRRGARR